MSERVAIVADAGGDLDTPDQPGHLVAPEAVADIISYLVSDAAAPVSGAIVLAYGA